MIANLQRESRFTPTHHNLQEIVVNVLAADQVERIPEKRRMPDQRGQAAPLLKGRSQLTSDRLTAFSQPKTNLEASRLVTLRDVNVEPLNKTLDRVRVQVQKMYVSRKRFGFWLRATLSFALLSVLGIVFYCVVSSSSEVELSSFF